MITLEGNKIDAWELYLKWCLHVRDTGPYAPPFREMVQSIRKEFENQKKNTDNPSAVVATAALDARDENWTVSADEKGIEDLEFIYDLYSRALTCPL